MKKIVLYIVLLGLSLACSKKNKPTKSKFNAVDKLTEVQKSVINLPIKLSNTVLAAKIGSYIPTVVYKDDNIDDDNYAFTVTRMGNPEISAATEGFMLSLPLKVEARAKVEMAGFGGVYPVYCEIKPKFQLIPTATTDWKVKVKTISQGFEWLVNPSVKVGFFTVDVTSMVETVLKNQQTQIAEIIDSYLANKIDLKPNASQLWANVQEPIFLSAENQAWFRFVPDSIALMPIYCENDMIKSGFRLKGNAEVISGQKPESAKKTLPNAGNLAGISADFSVFTSIAVSHDIISEIAKKQMVQKTFTFDGNKSVTINDLKFGEKNQMMRSESDVSGTYNGKIILQGNPYYDSSSQNIRIQNLDFEFDTKNKLHKTAAWLGEGKILKNLSPYLQFPMKQQLTDIENSIKKFLTNNKITPNIILDGKLSKLNPQKEIFVTDKNYILFLELNGTTETEILKLE